MDLIIGNLLSLFATGSDVVASARKSTKGFLLWQTLGQLFYGLSAIVLKGYSAAIQNAVCILRNLAAVRNLTADRNVSSQVFEWVLVATAAVLGLVFNNLGLLGLLPVIANLEYSLAVFWFKKNEVILKSAFLFNVVLYILFNWVIHNYAGVVADIVLFVVTLVFLIRNQRSLKKTEQKERS